MRNVNQATISVSLVAGTALALALLFPPTVCTGICGDIVSPTHNGRQLVFDSHVTFPTDSSVWLSAVTCVVKVKQLLTECSILVGAWLLLVVATSQLRKRGGPPSNFA